MDREDRQHLLAVVSSPPNKSLSTVSVPSTPNLGFAAERAQILFGCYRKGDANDPETYTAAITSILADYSAEVIQRVTDPRTGIPRRSKFMPNPAEVAEACDAAKHTIACEKKIKELGWYWSGDRWERMG